MRSAPSPVGAPRVSSSRRPDRPFRRSAPASMAPAGTAGPRLSPGRAALAGPGLSALTAERRGPERSTRRPAPASGPAPRRSRVDEHQRSLLGDLVAAVAAGAAACAALALAVIPSVPAGVALGAGAVVSAGLGWAVLSTWSRWAVRDGAPALSARRHALAGLVLAHAIAALPVAAAVLLAG